MIEIYDIINIILSFIGPEYYKNIAPVCKLWNTIVNKNKLLYFQKILPAILLPEKFKFIWINTIQGKILLPEFDYKCMASVFFDNVHLNYIIKRNGIKIGIKGNMKLDKFKKYNPYHLQIYKECVSCNNVSCEQCNIYLYDERNIHMPFLIEQLKNIKLMIKINGQRYLKGQYYYDPLKNPSLCKETDIPIKQWLKDVGATTEQISFITYLYIK